MFTTGSKDRLFKIFWFSWSLLFYIFGNQISNFRNTKFSFTTVLSLVYVFMDTCIPQPILTRLNETPY